MTELSLLYNGRFFNDLNTWNASNATYSAGDGDDHYGVAVLATGGGYVEQTFSVSHSRAFSVHTAVKGIGAAITAGQVQIKIWDGDGNLVTTINLTGASGEWAEATNTVGLVPGTTYTFRVTNVSAAGNVYLDDVWMWFIPITRAQIAARVHAKLGRLATASSMTVAPSTGLTEGSYTYAIDAALRSFGAVNPETGEPDVRYLQAGDVQTILESTRKEMLELLQADNSVLVDTTTGPYSQSLSQMSDSIGEMLGGSGSGGGSTGGGVVSRPLNHDNGWMQ